MKWKKDYTGGLVIGVVVFIVDMLIFTESTWFIPLLLVSAALAIAPIMFDFFIRLQKTRELENKFPDFVRNLVGAIKSGMPAPKAILHVSGIDYGALSPYVRKLANQIEWAIPVHKALNSFANATKSPIIKRSVSSVIEAETSGGNIEDVLESITNSVVEIRKIKQTRRAAIHSQIVQSYVIFFVFLAVMIVIQNLLVPYMIRMEQTSATDSAALGIVSTGFSALTEKVSVDFSSFSSFMSSVGSWFVSLQGVFLMLAIIQGFFAGLVMGKLSDGAIIQGLKHSLILMTIAFFVITLAQGTV